MRSAAWLFVFALVLGACGPAEEGSGDAAPVSWC